MPTHMTWLEFKRWLAYQDRHGSKDQHYTRVLQKRIERRYKWRERIWTWTRIDIG